MAEPQTIHRCKVRLPRGGFGDLKVIKNRSANVLVVRVDNIEFPLQPGLNEVPAFIVPYAVRQHPIPGTMRPSGEVESYVAVDGVTPDEQMGLVMPLAAATGREDLFDRSPETGKPLDPKRHEYVGVTRSSLVEGAMSRTDLARVLDTGMSGLTPGFD